MAQYRNFDCLRLGAAVSVLFSHAFLIAEGTQAHEPLIRLTGNQGILGLLGVFVFFVISGFLVTRSFAAGRSAPRFVAARALRILPALGVCLLLCAFLIGPLVTTLPLHAYLHDRRTWLFVAENVLMQASDERLPGVAFTGNPVGVVVNGTMWSLRFEVYCYLLVLGLGLARRLDLRSAALIFLGSFLLNLFNLADRLGAALKTGADLAGFLWLLPFFSAGMCLYFLGERAPPRAAVAALAALGFLAATAFGHMLDSFALFGSYLTIFLATSPRLRLPRAARFGDVSYGLYIYGWPAEQLIARLSGGHAPWTMVFAAGSALALLLALLSWHLVESPALRLKPRRNAAPAPLGPAGPAEGPAAVVPGSLTLAMSEVSPAPSLRAEGEDPGGRARA